MVRSVSSLLLFIVFLVMCNVANIENLFATNYFPKKIDVSVGNGPRGIRALDINKDGAKDLIVANRDSNSVTLLLNGGQGNFTQAPNSPINIGSGNGPAGIDTGDFNLDGIADFVLTNESGNNFMVFIGENGGNFHLAAGSPIGVGVAPFFTLGFNLNTDNILDLVALNVGSDNISIFLGNGDGSFTAASLPAISTGDAPVDAASGDFNGDGFSDLAITNNISNSLTVLLGNGNGTFNFAPASSVTLSKPVVISETELNGDSKLDLVITNANANNVSFAIGTGNGTFLDSSISPISTGLDPEGLVLNDLNGDGRSDLVISNSDTGNINVFLANSDGTFTEAPLSPIQVGDKPVEGILVDLNNDNKLDYAVTLYTSNSVTILFANKDPSLANSTFDNGQFKVTYTDTDGELPDASTGGNIKVTMNGTDTAMTETDATDADVTDGKVYQASMSLPAGTHTATFTASDGTYTTTLNQTITVADSGGGCAFVSLGNPHYPKNQIVWFAIGLIGLLLFRNRKGSHSFK